MKCSPRPPRLLPNRTAFIVLFALELACGKKHVAVPAPPQVPAQPAAESQPQAPPPIPRKPAPSPPASPQPSTPQPSVPAPAPQLGDVVTPDAQRQYNAAIDQSLARAQASLAAIGNRQLNKERQGLVEQIRNLIGQARAARTSDLPGAKSLAQRAEVLAKDLAASLR